MIPRYRWWPISFGWIGNDPMWRPWARLRYALKTLAWREAKYRDYGFVCAEALRVHRRAAWRIWHGWPIGNSATEYGRTVHIGRFKIYFGRRG